MSDNNPFYGDADHSMITQDMCVCDICGRLALRALCQQVTVVYGSQSKIVTQTCAECMHRMQFRPQRVLDETTYQRMADAIATLNTLRKEHEC